MNGSGVASLRPRPKNIYTACVGSGRVTVKSSGRVGGVTEATMRGNVAHKFFRTGNRAVRGVSPQDSLSRSRPDARSGYTWRIAVTSRFARSLATTDGHGEWTVNR